MTQALLKLVTFDEFIEWYPNDGKRYELYKGVIIEMPPPSGDHEDFFGFLTRKLGVEIEGFLAAKYIHEAELLPWLRRFGERLLASNASNTELAGRMILLRTLDIGDVGYVAHEIGMQLLKREEKINSLGSEEVKDIFNNCIFSRVPAALIDAVKVYTQV